MPPAVIYGTGAPNAIFTSPAENVWAGGLLEL